MAITDYNSLVAQVKRYCARSDSTFSAAIPDFVGLAEERLYNGHGQPEEPLYSPPLRSKTLEATGSFTVTDGVGTLPGNYLFMRRLTRSGDQNGLTYMTPERLEIESTTIGTGTPIFYTIEGSDLIVAPAWSGDLDALYYIRHPEISSSNLTGPLIQEHGYAMLEATLIEAFVFLQAAELGIGHAAKLRGIVSGINRSASALRYSGPLRVRHRRPMP